MKGDASGPGTRVGVAGTKPQPPTFGEVSEEANAAFALSCSWICLNNCRGSESRVFQTESFLSTKKQRRERE